MIRIFKRNRGLALFNFKMALTFFNFKLTKALAYIKKCECILLGSRTCQEGGATYHCLLEADLIHLTYVMRATLLGGLARGAQSTGGRLVVDWKRYTRGRLEFHDSHFQTSSRADHCQLDAR